VLPVEHGLPELALGVWSSILLMDPGTGLGCPAKPVSIQNNQKWNQNWFWQYPKQNVCFGSFTSLPKQQISVFRLNRNKKKINRKTEFLRNKIFLFCEKSSSTFWID